MVVHLISSTFFDVAGSRYPSMANVRGPRRGWLAVLLAGALALTTIMAESDASMAAAVDGTGAAAVPEGTSGKKRLFFKRTRARLLAAASGGIGIEEAGIIDDVAEEDGEDLLPHHHIGRAVATPWAVGVSLGC